MSRIGKKNINIPEKVSVEVATDLIKVNGPKGSLSVSVNPEINVLQNRLITMNEQLRMAI